jgi:hypothetical protein
VTFGCTGYSCSEATQPVFIYAQDHADVVSLYALIAALARFGFGAGPPGYMGGVAAPPPARRNMSSTMDGYLLSTRIQHRQPEHLGR